MITDETYMDEAINLAIRAGEIDEVPIGAIVVKNGEIIGRGYNKRESGKSSLAHAEIEAIGEACDNVGSWRLHDCELYVTLEPCPMCAGAIVNSRIKRVIFGASDYKAGAFGSVLNINDFPLNHKVTLTGGIKCEECADLLSSFFKRLRQEQKNTDAK